MIPRKTRGFFRVGLLLAMLGSTVLTAAAATASGSSVTPIPNSGTTKLPAFTGKAAIAHPLPPIVVPQNPYLAPDPFNNVHNDAWQSDIYNISGPLGRSPEVLSSTLAQARRDPSSPMFACGSLTLDSHGRIVATCGGGAGTSKPESSLVMIDPKTLKVLAYQRLPAPMTEQQAYGSAYMFLDNRDHVVTNAIDHIWVFAETGSAAHPGFARIRDYDLSAAAGADNPIQAVMPDWRGRLWFVTRQSGTVGVLDPKTGRLGTLRLGEEVSNSFAVNGTSAYIVSVKRMYRISAGADNRPYVVWSAPYKNIGTTKPGQLSAGSGTSPTLLGGDGQYVAINDNAAQMHIVVYRTAQTLAAKERRTVCQVPVFKPGAGATENSLLGYGRSLIVQNMYGYTRTVSTEGITSTPSEPGVARVDIAPDGKSCHLVWTNTRAAADQDSLKMSTKTGLIYAVTRTYDKNGLDVYYWTAIDYRTGKTVWRRMAGGVDAQGKEIQGTGWRYDSWVPGLFLGPNGTAYVGDNGGIMAIRDTR